MLSQEKNSQTITFFIKKENEVNYNMYLVETWEPCIYLKNDKNNNKVVSIAIKIILSKSNKA